MLLLSNFKIMKCVAFYKFPFLFSEIEAMVDHSEVYPQDTEFKIVEVFSVDNSHYGVSNTVTEVVIEEESDSDMLVVDHDFGYGASQGLHSDAEMQLSGQPGERGSTLSDLRHLTFIKRNSYSL